MFGVFFNVTCSVSVIMISLVVVICLLQVVFVDHNSKTTTFIDPRLPLPGKELKKAEDQGVVSHLLNNQKKFNNHIR